MSSDNEYMRQYMALRYARRKAAAVAQLGGKCGRCGNGEGPFEFDHTDPKTKTFTITKVLAGGSTRRVQAELAKCQLLCVPCHKRKTCDDRGLNFVMDGEVHGTISSARYCRCARCRAAKNAYTREYKKRRREESKKLAVQARSVR